MIQDHTHYRPVPLSMKPDSIGWHGNALLVKRDIEVAEAAPVPLPVLEPRGAIRADLLVEGRAIRVVGMHLDLSGCAGASRCAPCCRTLTDWMATARP
jgi:endonuclease/exonuclease/phosphatase family metal-dependent hydrolase